jgi:predicted transcriptional regulator
MDISQQLHLAGLHENEIHLYLYLLEQGLSSSPQMAKGTGIARTNIYHLLKNLKDKQLIKEGRRGKRHVYLANDPMALLEHMQRKLQTLEQIIPDLQALYTVQKNKPQIQFFDGFEQVKQIYLKTLSSKEIFAIGSVKPLSKNTNQFFMFFMKKLKQRQIIFHDILTHESKDQVKKMQSFLKGYWSVEFLPKQKEEMPTDLLIWGDHIALIALEEPIFGTIITNPLIAKSFRLLFQILQEQLTSNR